MAGPNDRMIGRARTVQVGRGASCSSPASATTAPPTPVVSTVKSFPLQAVTLLRHPRGSLVSPPLVRLTGHGSAGTEGRPVQGGELVVFGPGDRLVVTAADRHAEPLDVLLLGGLPIGAPIAHDGPVRHEHPGRDRSSRRGLPSRTLGTVPADQLAPRNYA
ncbi:MAG: pirin-like C-terminal cupin domain-containing protein [Acidimicrobiales bacterium]